MKKMTIIFAGLIALMWLAPVQAQAIKLQIKGAYWPGCAKALTKALGEVPGVEAKKALKPSKKNAQTVSVKLDTAKSDVGDVAKAIGGTKTPHANLVPPSTALVVKVKGIGADDTEKVKKALAGVKGVIAAQSSATKAGVVVQLDPKGGARLADIRKALNKAGG